MPKNDNTGAQESANHDKSRYVIRRFAPVLLLAAAVNISCLVVDVSKVLWVGVISGMFLAIALFLIRISAEKRYPGSVPGGGGS